MKLFNGILGIFSAFASIFCFFYPGRTFLNAGWMITFLLICWGACALFEAIANKGGSDSGKSVVIRGILAVVAGVVVCCASVVALTTPGLALTTDLVIVGIFLAWLFANGTTEIFAAIKFKKLGTGKKWIFLLVSGILTVLLGIYGLFHILLTAWAITIMFGVVLMGYSIRLLASVFE